LASQSNQPASGETLAKCSFPLATAILRVPPNSNSNGAGVYNNHPIDVYYIGGSAQRWAKLHSRSGGDNAWRFVQGNVLVESRVTHRY
jgi:hypothetical protein